VSGLHFAEPLWLWALLLPLPLWWLPRLRRAARDQERLERYADRALLPHLVSGWQGAARVRRHLGFWTLLWALGVVALAGPRLGYSEVSLYAANSNLMILLDLSRSMDAADVKPSRLARARQEVEDLLDAESGARVGLVAFASVSHVVTPLTEDAQTLRHLLPSLSTDLVRWSGSRLAAALDRTRRLLAAQPDASTNAVLLLSDGDFTEPGLEEAAARLAAAGIRLHVMGIGTPEGAPVPDGDGGWVEDAAGRRVMSRLDEVLLTRLARAGGGIYRRADFRDADTRALLEALAAADSGQRATGGSYRIWHERYYVPLLALMALMLAWFRRQGAAP
jgi:Ca-activated chloride channel family protein